MKTAAICILLILCAALTVCLILMKQQIKQITRELHKNLDPAYNRQTTITLLDRDLNRLCTEINHSLDVQRHLKLDAARAERNLRQSVSDIAHDLRTPMTVIKGNLQLLAQEEQFSERGAEYLAICRSKTDVLKDMADAFFEMSVLESDDTAPELAPINLTKVLMQFLADSEAAIRLHGLEPEIVFPEKTVYIQADEQMLVRMLGNVLNNLLKYAKESFRLTVSQDDACCTIAFSNTVSPEKMPDPAQMFARCYRADASRSGSGAGLGLYIVRLLAEKQNAAVRAQTAGNLLTICIAFPNAAQKTASA